MESKGNELEKGTVLEMDALLVDGKSNLENVVQQIIDDNMAEQMRENSMSLEDVIKIVDEFDERMKKMKEKAAEADEDAEVWKDVFEDAKYYAVENPDFEVGKPAIEEKKISKIVLENMAQEDAKILDMLDTAVRQYNVMIKNDTLNNAIDFLRNAVYNIEKELDLLDAPPVACVQTVDVVKKRTTKKASKTTREPARNRKSGPSRSGAGKNQRKPKTNKTSKKK
jgi:hypothetical protein